MIAVNTMRTACRAVLAVAVLSVCAPARSIPAAVDVESSASRSIVLVQAQTNLNTDAQIYLMRGLANVFSRGMDEMGATLQQHGFSPIVLNHRGWQVSADRIAENYRNGNRAPVIIVGHSLGANNAFRLAQRLQRKGVPVTYLATFDPTQAFRVSDNVRYFVNFYQNNGFGRRASFKPSRHKEKVNLNLTTSPGINHRNIDQSPRLQNIVIARILEVTAR